VRPPPSISTNKVEMLVMLVILAMQEAYIGGLFSRLVWAKFEPVFEK
jgi:hypothetical protein